MFAAFFAWLSDHSPEWCDFCSRVILRKDATWTRSTSGQTICLCKECHKQLFEPYQD